MTDENTSGGAERLRQLREAKRLTQADLARAAHVSSNYISMIERGIKNLSKSVAVDIAMTYGVRYEWLLAGEGEMQASGIERAARMRSRVQGLYEASTERGGLCVREVGGSGSLGRGVDMLLARARDMEAARAAGVATWEDLFRNIGRQLDEMERKDSEGD